MFDLIKSTLRNSDSLVGDFAGAAALVVMLLGFLHLPLLA